MGRAQRFGVGVVSAIRFVQRSRQRGDLTPDERGRNVRAHRIDGHANFILARLAAEADLPLAEIGERLHEACSCRPLPSVVHRFLARHGVTRKQDRARRRGAPSGRNQGTGRLARRSGRSRTGPAVPHRRNGPIHENGPHGHCTTTLVVDVLTLTCIVTPMAVGGAMNGPAFRAYVTRQLLPVLRPGDLVIMDRLPAHTPRAA